jgi:Tol biopolymer transport system component
MSDDGAYGVMTLNTTTLDIKKTTNGSDLCEIKLNSKGLYNKPKPISNKSINTSFFEGAATLTADGNTMYFVTDRKGDKSSTDIYVVQKVGKSWGEAEPLPFHINTTGRETTPYITPDGKYLFFSSDGHIGMGGLDIYVCENKGKEWGDPVNLGLGINTVNNDSHFVYSEGSKLGYISGIEVVGNKSSLDIYQMDLTDFTIPSPPTK